MVYVFYSQKTEQLINKIELIQWQNLLQAQINYEHQELSDNWEMCALGERIRIERNNLQNIDGLDPKARLLGYNFSTDIQDRDDDIEFEIIKKIEKFLTIWRN